MQSLHFLRGALHLHSRFYLLIWPSSVFFYLQGLNLSTFESEWVRSVKGQTGVFVAVFMI